MRQSTPKQRVIRLGLVQSRVTDDTERNLEVTSDYVSRAASGGAEIVCLQELFATRYFAARRRPGLRALAEPIPGRLSRFLSRLARDHGVILVGGSIFEKGRDGRSFNTTLVYDRTGTRIGKYRKMHIPEDPGYHEKYYFEPGNLGYVQIRTPKATIAPLICYDQWFPEPARVNVLKGAEILFYPTAIGWFQQLRQAEPSAARRWQHAMRAHASMNGVYAVAVNRVGREGRLTFWGGSFVADPFGDVVARASGSGDEVLIADIDLARVRESQKGWGFLDNRRPDSYGELTR